jgi:hypothetical protein
LQTHADDRKVVLFDSPPMAIATQSEVKGIWFDSARGWLTRHHDPSVLQRIERRVPSPYRGILVDPLTSQWYPEAALAEMLAALRAELTDGSEASFVQLIEQITLDGVGRFFRLVLALASPSFVLRKVPVLWARMRRGAGRVEVAAAAGAVRLRYREFPWFDDPNYRLMTVGTLVGICKAAGARTPQVTVVDWAPDALDVDVRP